ncbi:MAG: diaminopimelate decarboxylase, partial [Pseudomonadota bacterium]
MIGDYENGTLVLDGVPVRQIAEAVGTPLYLYSGSEMTRAYRAYTEALQGLNVQICYAIKANSNVAIIRHFARQGAGMDVVSDGELQRCQGLANFRFGLSDPGKDDLVAADTG